MPDTDAFSSLEDLRIASPCDVEWAEMAGDERVRFCGHCEKNVYNVAGFSRAEAEDLIRTQGDLCVRLSKRADGTLITNDCPVGATKKARRLKALAIAGGGLLAASALLLRNRVLAEETPQPRANAHLDELNRGSFWEELTKLVRKQSEPEPPRAPEVPHQAANGKVEARQDLAPRHYQLPGNGTPQPRKRPPRP